MRKIKTTIWCIAGIAIIALAMPSCSPEATGPSDPENQSRRNPIVNNGLDSTIVTSGQSRDRNGKCSILDVASSFILDNESNQELGTVKISGDGQFITLGVGASQVDTVQIPFTANSVTIESQICTDPDTVTFSLVNTATVQARFQSPDVITIVNYKQQN